MIFTNKVTPQHPIELIFHMIVIEIGVCLWENEYFGEYIYVCGAADVVRHTVYNIEWNQLHVA